jgi:acetyl/propionyl-CoA carboxylase alpha subunit
MGLKAESKQLIESRVSLSLPRQRPDRGPKARSGRHCQTCVFIKASAGGGGKGMRAPWTSQKTLPQPWPVAARHQQLYMTRC